MSSTVYIVEEADLFPCYHTRPFNLRWINSNLSFSFNSDDLTRIHRNQRIVSTNDKLWEAIGILFQRQKRFLIKTLFKDTSPGRGLCIHVSGPFLEKLKRVYEDFNALKLNLTLEHQSKSWSIDIGLNTIRQGGVLRIIHSERSQRLFRRIAALPDLKMSFKLTTRVNALHTRRLLSRHLLAESTPCDFHLISKNGTKVPFHKELLAAHSNVFGCPSVQSMSSFKLLVSDYILVVLKNYVYYGTCKDVKRDQRIALELLEISHLYNIVGLEKIMKKKLLALMEVPGDVGLDLVIMLYYFSTKVETGYEELREKALALILNTQRSEIEKSEAFQQITRNDKMFDGWKLVSDIWNFERHYLTSRKVKMTMTRTVTGTTYRIKYDETSIQDLETGQGTG
ncbi:unnamed protein product [Orchesella dallaii]|uniref:BTB domain-containing protein n=1 Tax=Orchesella dallaii TaxID=48710 RepID=A0ABP1RB16_9HEXA